MKSMRRVLVAFVAASSLTVSTAFAKAIEAGPEKRWDFRVYLDDKEIGYHRVRVVPGPDSERVTVEARFDVKFLFITAFSYDHLTEETWRGDCLTNLQASTDANGDRQFVRTREISKGFRLETHKGEQDVSGCLRSFAYWDPARLNAPALLNTQTGELQKAAVTDFGSNPIEIDGKIVDAVQYRLSVDGADIDLWYTPDRHWLALKTLTKDGYELKYLPDNGDNP